LVCATAAQPCFRHRRATVTIAAIAVAATIDARDYAQIIKIGRTSITGKVESWVRRGIGEDQIAVTEGIFTYVALGDDRRPRPLPPDS
jgi:acyl-CoA hydrolase